MIRKNELRSIGTRFKMIREPFYSLGETRKRCIEWEVVAHRKVFESLADKKGKWREEVKMISEEMIEE